MSSCWCWVFRESKSTVTRSEKGRERGLKRKSDKSEVTKGHNTILPREEQKEEVLGEHMLILLVSPRYRGKGSYTDLN